MRIERNVEKDVALLQSDVLEIKTGSFYSGGVKTKTAHGNTIQPDDTAIDKEITGLRVYGKTTFQEVRVSNQLAKLPDQAPFTKFGTTWSCSGGVVTVTGTSTALNNTGGKIDYQLPIVAGTYVVSGSTANVRVHVVITGENDTNTTITSSGGEPKTYTLTGTEKRVNLYLSVLTGVTANDEVKPMVNAGKTALPWEQYKTKNEIYIIGNDGEIEITVGEHNFVRELAPYGLAAIPIQITTNTKESDFTYADDIENLWISDYIDFANGLYYHNIGYIDSYNGEDVGSNYISETPGGVTEGDKVYYILPENERYTTPIEPIPISAVYPTNMSISNNKEAWMQVDYYVPEERDFNVSAIRTGYIDIAPTSVRCMTREGNIVYLGTRKSKIIKVDITNESSPEILATKTLDDKSAITGIAIQGDYIYAAERDNAGGLATTSGAVIGRLYVLDKSNLEEVKTIELPWKGAHIGLYKGYLYVPLQLYGFQVYDVTTDPTTPTLVHEYEHTVLGQREWQQVKFWSVDGKDYMAVTAFNWGIWFYNITDPTNPTLVGHFNTKILGTAGGFTENIHQIFDCIIEYPYIYATISVLAAKRFCPNSMRGIIKLRIDDLSKLPVGGNPYDAGFEYIGISKEDWWEYIGEGDCHPVTIDRLGDLLITNNGDMGFALFRATETEFRYLRRVSFMDKAGFSRAFVADNSGRLIAATDVSGFSGRIFTIYRFVNVNY